MIYCSDKHPCYLTKVKAEYYFHVLRPFTPLCIHWHLIQVGG